VAGSRTTRIEFICALLCAGWVAVSGSAQAVIDKDPVIAANAMICDIRFMDITPLEEPLLQFFFYE
jgi:hypothetical protein